VTDDVTFGAIFPTLETNISVRVGSAINQNVIVFEFHHIAEIMRMQNSSFKIFKLVKMRPI
jgi:hypothetical protein